MLELPAIILVFVSIFGFLNHKYLKLPLTVGLVLIALISLRIQRSSDRHAPRRGGCAHNSNRPLGVRTLKEGSLNGPETVKATSSRRSDRNHLNVNALNGGNADSKESIY